MSVILLFLLSSSVFAASSSATNNIHTMRIGVTEQLDSLSPIVSYTCTGFETFLALYDPLVKFDENLKPSPDIAKDWKLSDDQLTWTFHLRDDVKFHDGVPLTSADVKFSYDTIAETGMGMYTTFTDGIASIECPDKYTVVIHTKKPKANMLMSTVPILPEHIWKDVSKKDLETWPNSNPIGSGPFKFDEYKQGQYLKLKANDDYFLGRPHIDEIVYVFYANKDTMAQALKLGEIDAATNLSPTQKKSLESDKNIQVISAQMKGFTDIGFNCWTDPKSKGNKLLLDKNIRQAIEWAINKQQIIDVAYSGEGTVGTTIVDPTDYYHYQPPANELIGNNVEKAKEILSADGYKNINGDGIREDSKGNQLSFTLAVISDKTEDVKAAQMVAGMVKAAGIKLSVETFDQSVVSDKIAKADYDLFVWGWEADVDPTTILAVVTSKEIGNMSETYYQNPTYDKLHDEQQAIMDEAGRRDVVGQMQKILYDDVPYIVLNYDTSVQAVRTDKWTGWKQIPKGGPFFLGATNINYLNVLPVEAAVPAAAAPANTKASTGSSDKGLIIGGVIIIVIAIAVIAWKRRKPEDEE